jgi:hypothetical protein
LEGVRQVFNDKNPGMLKDGSCGLVNLKQQVLTGTTRGVGDGLGRKVVVGVVGHLILYDHIDMGEPPVTTTVTLVALPGPYAIENDCIPNLLCTKIRTPS